MAVESPRRDMVPNRKSIARHSSLAAMPGQLVTLLRYILGYAGFVSVHTCRIIYG